MATKNKSIVRLAVVALGALLVGLPVAARAAEPTSSWEADAKAQHYRDQAAHYRALGGVGWKSGLVQRAEGDAARYAALADHLRAPVAVETPRSPEAEHYAQLAENYRKMGGTAYKSGLVQWAEAQQRKYEAPPAITTPATTQPSVSCHATKPAVRMLACAR
jgi:hypothetical protein